MTGTRSGRGRATVLRRAAGFAALTAVGIVSGATVALGASHVVGAGHGTGSVRTKGAVTIGLTVSTGHQVGVDSGLGPGGTATMTVEVRNPNRRPFHVRSVVQSGPARVTNRDAEHDACSATAVTVLPAELAVGAEPLAVPPRARGQIQVALQMAQDADPECQGAVFRVPIKIMGRLV